MLTILWIDELALTTAAKNRKTRDSSDRFSKNRPSSAASSERTGLTVRVDPSRRTTVASRWAGYAAVTESACTVGALIRAGGTLGFPRSDWAGRPGQGLRLGAWPCTARGPHVASANPRACRLRETTQRRPICPHESALRRPGSHVLRTAA